MSTRCAKISRAQPQDDESFFGGAYRDETELTPRDETFAAEEDTFAVEEDTFAAEEGEDTFATDEHDDVSGDDEAGGKTGDLKRAAAGIVEAFEAVTRLQDRYPEAFGNENASDDEDFEAAIEGLKHAAGAVVDAYDREVDEEHFATRASVPPYHPRLQPEGYALSPALAGKKVNANRKRLTSQNAGLADTVRMYGVNTPNRPAKPARMSATQRARRGL